MKITENSEILFKENVHFMYLSYFYVENIHRGGGKMRL